MDYARELEAVLLFQYSLFTEVRTPQILVPAPTTLG